MSQPTNPEQKAAWIAQTIRKIAEDMQTPAYSERLRILAEDAFAWHQSFLAAGFNEQQALALTIAKL